MKNHIKIVSLLAFVLLLASCDHDVTMETTVHPDGRLDKVITFEQTDSLNIMGLDSRNGWKKTYKPQKHVNDSVKSNDVTIIYEKSFASAEEANQELATPIDSLFRVTSTFNKNFRWFYTYLYYADTYHALNRLSYPITDYVTPEDYAFIDRLPAEGKPISKADSLQLTQLNSKLYDIYGLRALYEEHFAIALTVLKQEAVAQAWQDTLVAHKERIFQTIKEKKDIEDDYLLKEMAALKIPLDTKKASQQYEVLLKDLEKKLFVISNASNGKYTHIINMPWDVVKTNADSTAGRRLIWNPPPIKFLIKDYTFYAESRQLNYWAIALTGVLIGFTVYLFLRKK